MTATECQANLLDLYRRSKGLSTWCDDRWHGQLNESSCRRPTPPNNILMCFFHRLKWRGRDVHCLFAFQSLQKAFGMAPNQMKCTGQTTAPAELKILVKFKFDYACCCVTVQNLTLGSSHKSIQCPENCFRWRPRADVTTVRATALELRPDQVKSRSVQSMLPSYFEEVRLPFFPSGLFLGVYNATCPHLKYKGTS